MVTTIKHQITPKDVIDKFMLALRNYELYPEHHAVTQASVSECMEMILTFLETEDSLPVRISRDSMLYQDEVLYQGTDGEENPAYQMYRDGIELLEFHQGVSRDDFQKFLKILRHHSHSRNQEENDIVTDLWGADLTTITYETTDVFWKDEPVIDFSATRVVDADFTTKDVASGEQVWTVSISEMIEDVGLFELTSEEIQKTVLMVHEEENRNFDGDIFDVLFVILKEQRKEDDFAVVLDIIMESFQNSLERAEFGSVIRFFSQLKELEVSYKNNQAWAMPYLEDFILVISSNEVLSSFEKSWQYIDDQNDSQLEEMRIALTELAPIAVHSLCPMIHQVPSSRIQRKLIESIKGLSKKEGRPLRMLLNHPDAKTVQNAAFILGYIPGKEATKALKGKLNTTTGTVRQEIVKGLAKRKPVLAKTLIKLADDPDPVIRKTVLSRLGQERNPQSEAFFIDMIQSRKFTKKNISILIKLYRALGGCGSSTAIPFLSKRLKKTSFFRRQVTSAHQSGAVTALKMLRLSEADAVLKKNSKKIQKISQQD